MNTEKLEAMPQMLRSGEANLDEAADLIDDTVGDIDRLKADVAQEIYARIDKTKELDELRDAVERAISELEEIDDETAQVQTAELRRALEGAKK